MNYPNGADSLGEWIKSMPGMIKATVAVVVLLVGLGFALNDYHGLPDRVTANEESIEDLHEFDGTLERALNRQERQLQRIICHLEEQRSDNPTWERCER